MAGSTNKTEQLHAARRELDAERDAHKALRAMIAAQAPHLLEQDKPEPVTEYTPDVCAKVLALADQGLTEAEWIAHLGLTVDTWREWLASFPELDEAAARGRARLLAYLAQMERRAIERGFHSIPAQVIAAMKADARRFERGDSDLGDASGLVKVTVSAGRESKPSG